MSEERKLPDRERPFNEMADRILLNSNRDFGGAFVIFPPGDEKPVSYLTIDSRQDPAMFWANIRSIAEISIAEMDERQKRQFGMR